MMNIYELRQLAKSIGRVDKASDEMNQKVLDALVNQISAEVKGGPAINVLNLVPIDRRAVFHVAEEQANYAELDRAAVYFGVDLGIKVALCLQKLERMPFKLQEEP